MENDYAIEVDVKSVEALPVLRELFLSFMYRWIGFHKMLMGNFFYQVEIRGGMVVRIDIVSSFIHAYFSGILGGNLTLPHRLTHLGKSFPRSLGTRSLLEIMSQLSIRKTTKDDLSFVLEMIQDLAHFEKAPLAVKVSVCQLEADFEAGLFDSIILEKDAQKVGMALFYFRYSTWKGKSLYLEDLYVIPEHRGAGLGKLVMKYLAKFAVEQKCGRFEWQVLDWNEPAIEFYKTLGADIDPEWMNCRLEGEAIAQLGKS